MSTLKHVLEVIDLLEDPNVNGNRVVEFLRGKGLLDVMSISVETIKGDKGSTDFITIKIPGREGRSTGGSAPH